MQSRSVVSKIKAQATAGRLAADSAALANPADRADAVGGSADAVGGSADAGGGSAAAGEL